MTPFTEELKKQDIIDQITWDDSVNANNIHVTVNDGKVVLRGSVQNYTAKMAAERDAYQVNGVQFVENLLEIKFPPGDTLPDEDEITGSIENSLNWNSDINNANISIETNQNVVTLSGTVNSLWEKHLATNLANSIRGVLEVKNDLNVILERSMLDKEIKESIERNLKRTYLIEEEKIRVEVKNGIVHLSGKVPSFMARIQAYNIALYTTGVKEVVDELTIW